MYYLKITKTDKTTDLTNLITYYQTENTDKINNRINNILDSTSDICIDVISSNSDEQIFGLDIIYNDTQNDQIFYTLIAQTKNIDNIIDNIKI